MTDNELLQRHYLNMAASVTNWDAARYKNGIKRILFGLSCDFDAIKEDIAIGDDTLTPSYQTVCATLQAMHADAIEDSDEAYYIELLSMAIETLEYVQHELELLIR